MLAAAGFVDIEVTIAPRSAEIVGSWLPGIEKFVASATIEARKPRSAGEGVLRAGVLRVTAAPAPWQDVAARLRPFVARRVSPSEIDDVMQDVFVRMQRGLPALRDEERFTSWLFQIARSSVAEHMRTRARHPLPPQPPERRSARRAGRG